MYFFKVDFEQISHLLINSSEKLKENSDEGRENDNIPRGVRSKESDSETIPPAGNHLLVHSHHKHSVSITMSQAVSWERHSPCPY